MYLRGPINQKTVPIMLTFSEYILKPVFNGEECSKCLWYLTPCHLDAFIESTDNMAELFH
jgi:hypothetical protein